MHLRLHRLFRDVGRGVFLDVELAALPWHGGKDAFSGRLQAGVRVTYDHFQAVQATRGKRFEELPPMDLCLRVLDTDSEHPAP